MLIQNTSTRVADDSRDWVVIAKIPKEPAKRSFIPTNSLSSVDGLSVDQKSKEVKKAPNKEFLKQGNAQPFQVHLKQEKKNVDLKTTHSSGNQQQKGVVQSENKKPSSPTVKPSCSGAKCGDNPVSKESMRKMELSEPSKPEKSSAPLNESKSKLLSAKPLIPSKLSIEPSKSGKEPVDAKVPSNLTMEMKSKSEIESKLNVNVNVNVSLNTSHSSMYDNDSSSSPSPSTSPPNNNNHNHHQSYPKKMGHGEFFLSDTERFYNSRYKKAIRKAMRSSSNSKLQRLRPTAPPKSYSFVEGYNQQPMTLLVLISSMEPDTVDSIEFDLNCSVA